MGSNLAILLVTCAIALAAPQPARIKQAWQGTEPDGYATDGHLERYAVRESSSLDGFARAAIRDDGDHLEDHREGVWRCEMQP